MSTRDELFAPKFADQDDGGCSPEAQQRMARELGADSLRYLPVASIARSVGLSSERLCQACVTGNYPSPTGEALYQIDGAGTPPGVGCGIGTDPRRTYERTGRPLADPALEVG
jgi:amidophosphoribosyltransferase